jgi:hypothetical protein
MSRFLGTIAIIGLGAILYSQYKKMQREQKSTLKKEDKN